MYRVALRCLLVAGLISVSAQAQYKAVQFAGLDAGPLETTLVNGIQIRAVDPDQQIEVVDGSLLPGASGNYGLDNLQRQALRVPSGGIEIRLAEPAFSVSLDVVNLTSLEGAYLSLFNGDMPVGVIQLADLLDPENALYDPFVQLGENSLNRIGYTMTGEEGETPWFDRVVVVLPEGASLGGVQMVHISGSGGGGFGFELTHIDEQSGGEDDQTPLPPLQTRYYGGAPGGGATRNDDPQPGFVNPLFTGGDAPLFPGDGGDDDLQLPDLDGPSTPGTPIPEPGSAVMIAAVLGGMLSMRRRLG